MRSKCQVHLKGYGAGQQQSQQIGVQGRRLRHGVVAAACRHMPPHLAPQLHLQPEDHLRTHALPKP